MSPLLRNAEAARASILLNVAMFQLGWWACVLYAANGQPTPAVLVLGVIVSIQVLIHAAPLRALLLALACLALGALVESMLAALRVTAYRDVGFPWGLAPPWMAGLWALLSMTLGRSLRWLQERPLLGCAVGAAAGALSYGAGARLGALSLPNRYSLWVIAAVWGLALPGLVRLAKRCEDGQWAW